MRSRVRNMSGSNVNPSSHTNWRYLNDEQKMERAKLVQHDRKQLQRKIFDLEQKLKSEIESNGKFVDREMSEKFKKTLENSSSEIEQLADDSPLKILWTEQQKVLQLKNAKGMRWHPLMIKWCIALQSKSTAAYNMIRQSGFLNLPTLRTIRNYSNFAEECAGFNAKVLQFVASDIKIDEIDDHQRNIALLFDEVKLKSGIAFSRRTGRIVGISDMGGIQNELRDFERSCSEATKVEQIGSSVATHMLVLMARGLCSGLNTPIAYFPSRNANSSELYTIMWEAVETLEAMGFHVRAFVSDGASANRKFYKLCASDIKDSPSPYPYYCMNKVRPNSRIYFICDVPHLIKTTRNNWENSGYHNKSRELEVSRSFRQSLKNLNII